MAGPVWLDGVFGELSALVAVYFVVRLAVTRGSAYADRTGDVAHLVMAVGMTAMFVPGVDPLPPGVWIAVFVLMAAWVGTGLLRAETAEGPTERGHHVHLVISSAAMVFMVTAMAAPAAGGPSEALGAGGGAVLAHDHGGGGPATALVSVALGAYFVLHAAWSAGRMARRTTTTTTGAGPVLFGPGLTGAAHVVMGLGMGYMLLAMVR
jgi:hypothetical protein